MSLKDVKVGGIYQIVGMQTEKHTLRRLAALGILEGTQVKVLNRKRNGATIIRARGTRWAFGGDIAGGIQVEEYTA